MTKCESSCSNNSESEQSSSSSQIDALGIPVSLTICAVVLATALPLLIRTIRIDRREEVAVSEITVAE